MVYAQELRINNWLLDGQSIMRQVEYVGATIGLKNDIGGTDKYQKNPVFSYDIEMLNPVPLSEDILLKCGFEKFYPKPFSSGHLTLHHNGMFYFRPSYLGGYYWGISEKVIDDYVEPSDCKPIQYLHQFQNWWYLIFGEELTYTP